GLGLGECSPRQVYALCAGLALRILVSLRSFMGEWSLGWACRCTRPCQCTRSVPGEAGWAWTGAHRAPATQHRRVSKRWCASRLVEIGGVSRLFRSVRFPRDHERMSLKCLINLNEI